MKKFLYLLLLLPLALMASCSDDDDLPNVALTVTFNNVAQYDNRMYAVSDKDYPFEVQSITVQPLNGSKAAALSMVGYNLDNRYFFVEGVEPFGYDFGQLAEGNHMLAANFSILQVDKSIFQSHLEFYFTVVPTVADLPGGVQLGTVTSTFNLEPKKK